MPWHPTVPIKHPQLLFLLNKPSDPCSGQFQWADTKLGKRSEGFNPSPGWGWGGAQLICCISWGPHGTFLLGFPLLSDPSLRRIMSSSETGLCSPYFKWGFIWDRHIKRYLAMSLLQWFLSGQPNESSAGDPKGGSGLSNSRPRFWNFQEE